MQSITLHDEKIRHFHNKGFLVLENVIPLEILTSLKDEVNKLLNLLYKSEDEKSHQLNFHETSILRKHRRSKLILEKGCVVEPIKCIPIFKKRYIDYQLKKEDYINLRSTLNAAVAQFAVSNFMRQLVLQLMKVPSTSSLDLYLLNEQYILKPPHSDDSAFPYHQDSEYLPCPNIPYVSCWVSLNEMKENNGTLYIIPYRSTTISDECPLSCERWLQWHESQAIHYPKKADLHYNIDNSSAFPILVPAGSIVLLSSLVLHRSSPNHTGQWRCAWMPQYSFGSLPTKALVNVNKNTETELSSKRKRSDIGDIRNKKNNLLNKDEETYENETKKEATDRREYNTSSFSLEELNALNIRLNENPNES